MPSSGVRLPNRAQNSLDHSDGKEKSEEQQLCFSSRFLRWFYVFSLLLLLLLRHSPLLPRRWEAQPQPPPAGLTQRSGQRRQLPSSRPPRRAGARPRSLLEGWERPSITAPFPTSSRTAGILLPPPPRGSFSPSSSGYLLSFYPFSHLSGHGRAAAGRSGEPAVGAGRGARIAAGRAAAAV